MSVIGVRLLSDKLTTVHSSLSPFVNAAALRVPNSGLESPHASVTHFLLLFFFSLSLSVVFSVVIIR